MSFESGLAAIGRAIDHAIQALRDRFSHSRPSIDVGALRQTVSDRLSRSLACSGSVLTHSSRVLATRNRNRLAVAALVVIIVALAAMFTSRLMSTTDSDPGVNSDRLERLARDRDTRRAGPPSPMPLRSTTGPTIPTGPADARRRDHR